jgi:hypothetical protein
MVSELHHVEGLNWINDSTNKATIVNNNLTSIDEIEMNERDFCWILSNSIRLYSCYWFPNSILQEFTDFLTRLQITIRSNKAQVLVTDDFNAHHTDWGKKNCNKRGEALSDFINGLGLFICNTGDTLTFRNQNGTSIIDLTLATPSLVAKITEWEVMDTISLSDHSYILFKINTSTVTNRKPPTWNTSKVNCQKLEEILKNKKPSINTVLRERRRQIDKVQLISRLKHRLL